MKLAIKILLLIASFFLIAQSLLTSRMVFKKAASLQNNFFEQKATADINITTSCNILDFKDKHNYSGIVRSGYLTVDKNNSALAFTFYGQKDVREISQLSRYPTILWLNGGPGSSSQLGNLQQIGPLRLIKDRDLKLIPNNYTWANYYNLLFVDQPVGTGLSYADKPSYFAKSMDEVADDFYRALNQLYTKGCFSGLHLSIPPSNPLIIFGQSYAGKYVPAIAKKIVEQRSQGGFLTGLKGIAIGDGFTFPYEILSQLGTYSFHMGFLDYQQRMRLEKILLNASRHNTQNNYDALHYDFENAIDYVVDSAGGVNVYDIKIDGQYQELLQPYFRNKTIATGIYGFNPDIVYDSQAEEVYKNLYTDFMKPEINRVEYLLSKGVPVLIYNGQDDLIVQNPGTMKWVDRLHHTQAEQFRKALFAPWKVNGKMAGSIKSAGNLEFRIVNEAGHLVPMNRPVEALDMAVNFVSRVIR